MKGNDFLYLGLGVGALWLIFSNTKPLVNTVSDLSGVIGNAADVVNPVLKFAAQGTNLLTNPASAGSKNFLQKIGDFTLATFPPTALFGKVQGWF